jgi:sugar transferase EpsL
MNVQQAIKRIIDLVVSVLGLTFGSPVLAAVAGTCRVAHGRPVLHRATRAGMGERPFVLYKFRSMTDERGPDGRLLADVERLTRFGRFLRSLSLDELPQLWNVLRGDMSLVGPRPLPVEYLARYTPEERRRHEVRPGITGWAQVSGRNELDWDDRLALDVWYVDHQSLWLDARILGRTAWGVLRRTGIGAAGEATGRSLRPELAAETDHFR